MALNLARSAAAVAAILATAACSDTRPEFTVVIPEGFHGWAFVCFQLPGEPDLSLENGRRVVRIPASGVLRTGTMVDAGFEPEDEFYVESGGQWTRLDSEGGVPDQRIWGLSSSQRRRTDTGEVVRFSSSFFVGTREEWTEGTVQGLPPRNPCYDRDPGGKLVTAAAFRGHRSACE